MNNQKLITIYTLGAGILTGIIFGFKTTQGFLTGKITSLSSDIGGIFGALFAPLLIALIVAVVRYFYLLLKKKPRNFLLTWMQIGAVTVTIFLILVLRLPKTTIDNNQTKDIATSIQKDLKDSLAIGFSEGKRLEGDFGELAAFVEILNDLRAEVSTIQREIKTEGDQCDFETLFTSENITNADNIQLLKGNFRDTISKLEGTIISYKEIQDKFVIEITQADINSIQKHQILNGFEENRPVCDKAFYGFMKNEIAIYNKLIDIFTFFEEKQGEFKIANKMPHFSSERDTKIFGKLITSMQYLGVERERLAKKMIKEISA